MLATLIISTLLSLLLIAGGYSLYSRMNRKAAGMLCLLLAITPLTLSTYILYFTLKPYNDVHITLLPGAVYTRTKIYGSGSDQGKQAVVHTIALDAKRIRLTLTSPELIEGKQQHRAMTTTDALKKYGGHIAINGSFFAPFTDNHLFDYYPHRHDLVEALGPTVVNTQAYGATHIQWPGLVVDNQQQLSINNFATNQQLLSAGQVQQLLSGRQIMLSGGEVVTQRANQWYPRSAIGLNAQRDRLWLVVVDGKQPGYSDGLPIAMLADYVQSLGADTALELDGGGSATLAWSHRGQPILLSRPIHTKIPNRQRPVANHLLITVK